MKTWRNLAVICVLAGCATPQTRAPAVASDAIAREAMAQQMYVISSRIEDAKRVESIYGKLRAANLEFCKTKSGSIGAGFHSLSTYPKKFQDAAKGVGVPEAQTVSFVLDGSPAAQAGLRPGDQIVKIDGEALAPKGAGFDALRAAVLKWAGPAPLVFSVERDGAASNITVTPVRTCGYPVLVAEDDALNAAADGKSVLLQRGMLRFVRDDQELALVLGHELAHNAMGHIDAKQRNATMGMIGGAILDGLIIATTGVQSSAFMRAGANAGAGAYSKDFETEADYVGLYFMARAGFDISGAESFWRRMAAERPDGIIFASSHPTTAERYVAISAAREEILASIQAGAPLRPRMKGDDTAAAPTKETSGAPEVTAPADASASPPPPVALTP